AELGLERLQQRALDEKALGENLLLDRVAALRAALGQADLDHLPRIIPLIDRRGDVEALIALEANEPPPQRLRQHLGDLGLADPGLAFEEKRPFERQRQIDRRREA